MLKQLGDGTYGEAAHSAPGPRRSAIACSDNAPRSQRAHCCSSDLVPTAAAPTQTPLAGAVWKAVNRTTNETVAIKKMVRAHVL